MSAVGWRASTASVASGTTAKTILQVVAAANHALWVKGVSVSFEGTSNTAAPVMVEVLRQTDAGTMSSLTPVKNPDDSDETLQVTAQHTATVEPAAGDVQIREFVHPQTGWTEMLRLGEWIKVGGGDRLAVRVTAAANVNVIARMWGEE